MSCLTVFVSIMGACSQDFAEAVVGFCVFLNLSISEATSETLGSIVAVPDLQRAA